MQWVYSEALMFSSVSYVEAKRDISGTVRDLVCDVYNFPFYVFHIGCQQKVFSQSLFVLKGLF